MRMGLLMLSTVFLLTAAAQAAPAQTQQGQSDTSTSSGAAGKQPASAAQAQRSPGTLTTPGQKPVAKPGVVLTNDNINDAAAKKAMESAAPSSNAQADPPKAAPKQDPPAPGQQQNPQSGAPVAKPKPQLEPHKVLTNENLPNVLDKHGVNVVGMGADLSDVYDCDVNCYNQVRQAANVYPSNDLSWMRDLHAGIEKLTDDEKWRAHLVSLVNLRVQYCKLADEEARALARVDNENNVTDEQISIREDYNRKVAELGQEFQTEYGRSSLLEARYSPLVRSFMQLQEQRIARASCMNSEPYGDNSDPDDPDEL